MKFLNKLSPDVTTKANWRGKRWYIEVKANHISPMKDQHYAINFCGMFTYLCVEADSIKLLLFYFAVYLSFIYPWGCFLYFCVRFQFSFNSKYLYIYTNFDKENWAHTMRKKNTQKKLKYYYYDVCPDAQKSHCLFIHPPTPINTKNKRRLL